MSDPKITLPELAESLERAFAQVLTAIDQVRIARVTSPVTEPDHAEGQLESMKRYLLEDAVLAIASELLYDPRSAQVMQALGLYDRLVAVCRQILHWRAHPQTSSAAEMIAVLKATPISERPVPFNTITKSLEDIDTSGGKQPS